jgi:biotin-dependent carboxylase-like uncharacterized protein
VPVIEVLRAGALTTVQDLGRTGWRASGVPAGGAFDPWSARVANRLVGNADGEALLEITLTGPALRFSEPAVVAWAGDPFECELEGRAAPAGESFEVGPGAMLRMRGARRGVRAWLAVAGGLSVEPCLGSAATEISAGFGGHRGRALRAGDRLECRPAPALSPRRRFAADLLDRLAGHVLRIVPGPDERLVPGMGSKRLTGRPFRVGVHSDRRGIRLEGSPVTLAAPVEARSQGILPGAVQLPSSGEPILLGVDAPVTGGYPWIAQVVEADVGRLAHLAPGEEVRFELVDFDAAERALAELERALATALEPA